jgi:outer membrane protein
MARTRASRWLAFVSVTYMSSVATVAEAADLVGLYTLAQTSDSTFQSAQHVLEAAKQKRPEAFSGLLPVLSANGVDSRTEGRTRYTDSPDITRTFNSDQWTLQLVQPVFRADRMLAYGEARATVEQALAQYDAARQDLMLRLSRAYFDEIVAERHVTATKAQLVSLNEQLQAARRSFEAGVASITDVDDTRARAASAQAQEVGALNDLESARAALEAIIGEPPGRLAALRSATTLPKPSPSDVATWVQQATQDNPGVRAAQALAKAADYELDRSRAQRLPSVDLVATYGGNYAGGNITDPINYDTIVRDKAISVQFNMPLLDGGGMHAQVAEARAQRAKAQSDITTAQRQAALDARQSYAAALSGASQVEALETAVSAGLSAVKGNRVGYGLGIRINSDVLNAEQQLYSTMQDLDKARYDTLYAGLKLKAATGQLTPADLSGINSLLDDSTQMAP